MSRLLTRVSLPVSREVAWEGDGIRLVVEYRYAFLDNAETPEYLERLVTEELKSLDWPGQPDFEKWSSPYTSQPYRSLLDKMADLLGYPQKKDIETKEKANG
jgi:hypothetical protein